MDNFITRYEIDTWDSQGHTKNAAQGRAKEEFSTWSLTS
jgi:hypothetical protein